MLAKRMVNTLELEREQWLEVRRSGVSGSDLGAILGLNKWKSPIAVYLEKMNELPEQEDNERMYWGRTLENVVADEFKKRSGFRVQRVNAVLQHPEEKWAIANIDRLITNEKGEKGILEVKTVSEYGKGEWEGEEVPESYMVQLQWYLYVTGLKYGYFSALIGGNKYIQKYVERDDELIKAMVEVAKDFWHKVENKIPPALDGSDSSSDVLKMFYPEAKEGSSIMLDDEVEKMIIERDQIKEELKSLEFKKDEIENQIKAMLEDNEVGTVKNYIVSWKNVSTTRIDSKALKKDQPKLYAEYSNTTSSRKFDIKIKKEGK